MSGSGGAEAVMVRGSVQIKICGLTDPEEAVACVRLGADAIGVVFYPPSPRSASIEQASAIRAALGDRAKLVGVFVNRPAQQVIAIAENCGLDAVQLHGNETPGDVQILQTAGLRIIKVLKDEDFLSRAELYAVPAFLIELGRGILPGGNGQGWAWEKAASFRGRYPFILAGGLTPLNIERVVNAVCPDAIDASSALEVSPGRKDLKLVEAFINAARKAPAAERKRIF